MAQVQYKRYWYRFWKVEYAWTHTGYGTVVGSAWTKRASRHCAYKAVYELTN